MSVNTVRPPFPVFQDIDGTPLEAGYIYIGQPNLDAQSNPKPVFFDSALTIPAPQPIRTLAGFPRLSGAAAQLFVEGSYSTKVLNAERALIYAAPVEFTSYQTTDTFLTIAGQQAYTLPYSPGSDRLRVVLNTASLTFGEHYTISGAVLTLIEPIVQGGDFLAVTGGTLLPVGNANYDTGFASRAAAIATSVPALQQTLTYVEGGQLVSFVRMAGGTALVQADGSTWVPAGTPTRAHFADAAAMLVYAATLQPSYPKGGIAEFGIGRFPVSESLLITDGMNLSGQGLNGRLTTLLKATGAFFAIQSWNWDALFATNRWFVTEEVPTGISVSNITIDGQQPESEIGTADRGGVALFTKDLHLEVKVQNIDGVGIWLRCGNQVGQTLPEDMPLGKPGKLAVRRSGGPGIIIDGPHDGVIGTIDVGQAGYADRVARTGVYPALDIRGVLDGADMTNYLGYNDFPDTVHVYNSSMGVRITHAAHFSKLISESNWGQDYVLEATAKNNFVAWLQTYRSSGSDGDDGMLPSVQIKAGANRNVIARHQSSSGGAGIDAVLIQGDYNDYNGLINYPASTGYGITVEGDNNKTEGHIIGFSGTGGVGLHLDGATFHEAKHQITNCETACILEGAVAAFNLDLQVDLATGQDVFNAATRTLLTGLADVPRRSSSIKIRGQVNGSTVSSVTSIRSAQIDVRTTAVIDVVTAHGLCMAPRLTDVQVTLQHSTASFAWRTEPVEVRAVDATSITVRVSVIVAEPGAASGNWPFLNIKAHIPCGI